MGTQHDHGPSAAEAAVSPVLRRRLVIACALVSAIVVAQAVGVGVTGSLALLVDLVHSVTDQLGLVVALVAAVLMSRPVSARRTWGFRRVEVLAALAQAALLIGVSVFAVVEGAQRLIDPPEVDAPRLLAFALLGLVLNLAAAAVLAGKRTANLNMRAAFLEVLMDALGSVAVAVSAVVMLTTGFASADAIAAFVIALLIVPRAVVLIRDAWRILMEFAPAGLDVEAIRAHLEAVEHVEEVHDLHVSTVASGLHTLTAHVVLDDSCFQDGHVPELLKAMRVCVAEHFEVAVEHTTFQLEPASHHHGEPALHP